MTTYHDRYDEFADNNAGGSTFMRTIAAVTPASAHVQVFFSTFGDFDFPPDENVNVSIEGYDLGTFLNGNTDDDRWTNLDAPTDRGDEYTSTWHGVADIPADVWNAITADGNVDITYTLGGDVNDFGPGDFLDITFSDSAPTLSAVADVYSATEDSVLVVGDPADGLLFNDGNPMGTGVALATGPQHGALTLNSDGTFTYRAKPDFSGDDSFTYAATDGTDTSFAQTVTIHVAAVNDAPSLAPTFKATLLDSNSQVVDHEALTSDDHGGIAVSDSRVFVTGDGTSNTSVTASFDRDDLSDGTAVGGYDGLITDLATRQVYVMGTDATTPLSAYNLPADVTHLLLVDGATGALTGASIALSTAIHIGASGEHDGVFSGAGHAIFLSVPNSPFGDTTGTVLDIDLGTGTVTHHGFLNGANLNGSETFADFGIVEQFDGETYLTYRSSTGPTIERIRLSDGQTQTAATFTDLSDLASFTVAADLNRWYFHYEGSGQFGGTNETLGYADATFDIQNPWDDATFLESVINAAPQLIDPSVSLVDPDSTFADGGFTVGYAAGGGSEDNLGIRNQGTGTGQVGRSGNGVSFGGVAIGTVSGGAQGADLVVSFNGNATRAGVEAVLENLTYGNTSDAPQATRTLSLVLDDGDGGVSAPITAVVTVTPEDDAATARNDAFTVAENATLTGNVLGNNGSGADDPDGGPAPLVAAVNGQAAAVGSTITLASGATMKLNADGTLSYDPHHGFDTLPAVGSGASNTSATDTFTYTLATGGTATVAVTVTGVDSDDVALGTSHHDIIHAGKGDDTVRGFQGSDDLFGGAGADMLFSGKGADRLHAGKDDAYDVVFFGSIHASGNGKPDSWDRIYDFDRHGKHEKTWDKIDLSDIDADKSKDDDQAFRFVDHFSKAEGKEPAGEVMIEDAGKNVEVLVDRNGDKDPDMILLVTHVHDLHKADFIL